MLTEAELRKYEIAPTGNELPTIPTHIDDDGLLDDIGLVDSGEDSALDSAVGPLAKLRPEIVEQSSSGISIPVLGELEQSFEFLGGISHLPTLPTVLIRSSSGHFDACALCVKS